MVELMVVAPVKTTFTLAEAAALLSCHTETLRRAIRVGELRAAKLGREYRISRLDLEAFWSACGGGDLFVPHGDVAVERGSEETEKMSRDKGKNRKRGRQEGLQLPLLPDEKPA
jgi:excisionase family DNA binding protein